ncbi:hypothetical protein CBR_g49092 [Chara braunii]|uniref:Uncharacterized protein n=1 Tax=Chara braunii TaxID=69332 RepID=A0A388K4Z9_CHABU|nr:hypothetical protein CBR_g49092 [Chara braunii]|eukprot:GBG65023.1 hypothetical protein CBR_g49092 [Chara braunii]
MEGTQALSLARVPRPERSMQVVEEGGQVARGRLWQGESGSSGCAASDRFHGNDGGGCSIVSDALTALESTGLPEGNTSRRWVDSSGEERCVVGSGLHLGRCNLPSVEIGNGECSEVATVVAAAGIQGRRRDRQRGREPYSLLSQVHGPVPSHPQSTLNLMRMHSEVDLQSDSVRGMQRRAVDRVEDEERGGGREEQASSNDSGLVLLGLASGSRQRGAAESTTANERSRTRHQPAGEGGGGEPQGGFFGSRAGRRSHGLSDGRAHMKTRFGAAAARASSCSSHDNSDDTSHHPWVSRGSNEDGKATVSGQDRDYLQVRSARPTLMASMLAEQARDATSLVSNSLPITLRPDTSRGLNAINNDDGSLSPPVQITGNERETSAGGGLEEGGGDLNTNHGSQGHAEAVPSHCPDHSISEDGCGGKEGEGKDKDDDQDDDDFHMENRLCTRRMRRWRKRRRGEEEGSSENGNLSESLECRIQHRTKRGETSGRTCRSVRKDPETSSSFESETRNGASSSSQHAERGVCHAIRMTLRSASRASPAILGRTRLDLNRFPEAHGSENNQTGITARANVSEAASPVQGAREEGATDACPIRDGGVQEGIQDGSERWGGSQSLVRNSAGDVIPTTSPVLVDEDTSESENRPRGVIDIDDGANGVEADEDTRSGSGQFGRRYHPLSFNGDILNGVKRPRTTRHTLCRGPFGSGGESSSRQARVEDQSDNAEGQQPLIGPWARVDRVDLSSAARVSPSHSIALEDGILDSEVGGEGASRTGFRFDSNPPPSDVVAAGGRVSGQTDFRDFFGSRGRGSAEVASRDDEGEPSTRLRSSRTRARLQARSVEELRDDDAETGIGLRRYRDGDSSEHITRLRSTRASARLRAQSVEEFRDDEGESGLRLRRLRDGWRFRDQTMVDQSQRLRTQTVEDLRDEEEETGFHLRRFRETWRLRDQFTNDHSQDSQRSTDTGPVTRGQARSRHRWEDLEEVVGSVGREVRRRRVESGRLVQSNVGEASASREAQLEADERLARELQEAEEAAASDNSYAMDEALARSLQEEEQRMAASGRRSELGRRGDYLGGWMEIDRLTAAIEGQNEHEGREGDGGYGGGFLGLPGSGIVRIHSGLQSVLGRSRRLGQRVLSRAYGGGGLDGEGVMTRRMSFAPGMPMEQRLEFLQRMEMGTRDGVPLALHLASVDRDFTA